MPPLKSIEITDLLPFHIFIKECSCKTCKIGIGVINVKKHYQFEHDSCGFKGDIL